MKKAANSKNDVMVKAQPFLRLLAITSLTFVFCLIGLMMLRWLGLQTSYATSNNPWMKELPWKVVRAPADTCQASYLQSVEPKAWLWLDVQMDRSEKWHLVCPDSKLFDEDSAAQEGPTLESVLQTLPNRKVIFNVRERDIPVAPSFLKTVQEWANRQPSVGIASPSQRILRDLRKERPDWLFGADFSTWAKLRLYATFGIQTAADLWPDFFIASTHPRAQNFFFVAGAREILRRNRVLVLQWEDDQPIPPDWLPFLSGILTNRPKNPAADTILEKMGAR